MVSIRDDRPAKKAFINKLKKDGYTNIEIKSKPADIVAYKDNKKYYFEIKKTSSTDKYFGAATLTEWEEAIKEEVNYFFVVCIEKKDMSFEFRQYTPDEFLEFSTIPPFKVYFSVPLSSEEKKKKPKRINSIGATRNIIKELIKNYNNLRKIN